MLRKTFIAIIAASMVLSMSACGEKEDSSSSAPEESATQAAESDKSSESSELSAGEDTVGQILLQDFFTRAEDGSVDSLTLANDILTNSIIQFSGATMPVEQGLLTGFGNAEITGFKEGVMFAPMIGSIAFVGYIFELEDGTDADAFMKTLSDNADPRWNICTEAEETVVEKSGNKVFFLMCPKQFEE